MWLLGEKYLSAICYYCSPFGIKAIQEILQKEAEGKRMWAPAIVHRIFRNLDSLQTDEPNSKDADNLELIEMVARQYVAKECKFLTQPEIFVS